MGDQSKDIILSIRGMSKSFGRNRVLDHINLDVRKGTVMGLMGENGAGKSTMMKCLFGTYQKDEGTIYLDGKEVNFSGPKDALENGIAMVHQELNQCLERNVVDNLFLGRYPVNSLGMIDEGRMKNEASELFRKLGMTVNLDQPMRNMSVSQRQMCEIACLIDDSLKNRSGHVLPPGPGIQKRHNVRLREHAAAGRNGIDRLRVGREFIEP